jgi:hypothetical protein
MFAGAEICAVLTSLDTRNSLRSFRLRDRMMAVHAMRGCSGAKRNRTGPAFATARQRYLEYPRPQVLRHTGADHLRHRNSGHSLSFLGFFLWFFFWVFCSFFRNKKSTFGPWWTPQRPATGLPSPIWRHGKGSSVLGISPYLFRYYPPVKSGVLCQWRKKPHPNPQEWYNIQYKCPVRVLECATHGNGVREDTNHLGPQFFTAARSYNRIEQAKAETLKALRKWDLVATNQRDEPQRTWDLPVSFKTTV